MYETDSLHDQLGPDFPREHTFIALENIGNTGYVNCILQSLYNLPRVIDWINRYEQIINSNNLKHMSEMAPLGLFVKIFIDSEKAQQNIVYYQPKLFYSKVCEQSEYFVHGKTFDSAELLDYMIDSFDSSVEMINQRIGTKMILLFSDLFQTSLSKRVNQKNSTPSFQHENLTIIPVAFDKAGIPQCLYNFFEEKIGEQSIHREIASLPDIIVLKLQIFKYDMDLNKYIKIHHRAPIQTNFSISDSVSKNNYELYSVCMHCGEEVNSGHYFCLFKTIQERWIFSDDNHMRPMNDEEVFYLFNQNDLFADDKNVSYLLFYQKINIY